MRERIKRRAKFLPDPQERMTGLADVTKRSIPRFKEVSPIIVRKWAFKRRITLGLSMCFSLAFLSWWAYMPEKLLTQPLAYLKPEYVHLVNDTLTLVDQICE